MRQLHALGAVTMVFAIAAHGRAQPLPVVIPTIANADFETDAALFTTFPGSTGSGSNPAEITSWPGGPGTGGRGINPGNGAGSPFRDNGNNTTNVAFLQVSGTSTTRNIGQVISGWEEGENYRIAFDYNARNCCSGSLAGITATIGSGSFVDPSVTPTGGNNSYYAGNILFTPSGTAETLTITANLPVAGGDRAILVDNFRVFRNGPTIANNNFEAPEFAANQFKYHTGMTMAELAAAEWTMTGGAAITRNISAFQNGNIRAPEGDQHAVLQGNASFSQLVSGFEVGADYNLSLLAMARQANAGGNDLEVILDLGLMTETFLIDEPLISFASFTELVSSPFTAEKDSYMLTIRSTLDGGNLTGDRSTFIDNIWLNQLTFVPVPEPATVTIWLLLGAAAFGVAWRRSLRPRSHIAFGRGHCTRIR